MQAVNKQMIVLAIQQQRNIYLMVQNGNRTSNKNSFMIQSLGGERLTPKILDHYLHLNQYML